MSLLLSYDPAPLRAPCAELDDWRARLDRAGAKLLRACKTGIRNDSPRRSRGASDFSGQSALRARLRNARFFPASAQRILSTLNGSRAMCRARLTALARIR